MPDATTVFDLPDRLAAKRDPALIDADERYFAALGRSLVHTIAELNERLDAELGAPGRWGQQAVERDLEVRRLSTRLRALQRFGLDVCLGRMVRVDTSEPAYIGRFGLTDRDGTHLLVDWRSPAAEPFFAATHGQPMGLASRRRYRWTLGRIADYWDEVFDPDALDGYAALDDQSAFIASLGGSRSARMRDVLATMQADQDAIIRAGSRGALVVDGGPGTGKTVVALHRTAYLLYSDPRLSRSRGGVLFVGPHPQYLAYVSDVLPSLGEDGVHICTIRDLVPGGRDVPVEPDAELRGAKAAKDAVRAVEEAVRGREYPPAAELVIETPWADIAIGPDDWAEAFDSVDRGTPHNLARAEIRDRLVEIVVDRLGGEVPERAVREAVAHDGEVDEVLARAWPLLDPERIIRSLWPQRHRFTLADLPLLDAAHQLVGDPNADRLRRERDAALAIQQERMDRVVDDLIAADDSEMLLMSMLRRPDAQHSLIDEADLPAPEPDELAGPFAHIVIDEAQELTDAEWQMLLRRCPSRSFTIVGDRAQARHGFTESWQERLERVGLVDVAVASLNVNYRTPAEVMTEAEPVIRVALPDANVPTSIRSTGIPVRRAPLSQMKAIVDAWLASSVEGTACIINAPSSGTGNGRVAWLTPESAKGLEFDLVVLVDPESLGGGIEGAVDRYVAMTRATQQLVILTP